MGPGLAHDDLEGPQVQVAGRPLGDVGVGVEPVRLLVVEGEVLDGDPAPRVPLHAPGDAGGDAPGQQRVLREVLEVAPAQDGAVQVEGGGQPQVGPEVVHLGAHEVAVGLGQGRVPGLGDGGADGDGGGPLLEGRLGDAGLLVRVEAEGLQGLLVHELGEEPAQRGAQRELAVGVHAHLGGDAQAGGPVGHDQRGQALEAGRRLSGGADERLGGLADDGLLVGGLGVLAQDDVGQLLVAQALDEVLGVGQVDRLAAVGPAQGGGLDVQARDAVGDLDDGRGGGPPVGEAGVAQGVVQLAHDGGLGQVDDGGGDGVAAGGPHAHHVVAGLQDGGGPRLVVGGQVGQVEGDDDLLGGAGGELVGLAEARQRLVGLVEPAGRDRDVDLDDLLARVLAGVGRRRRHAHLGAGDGDGGRAQLEARVAQAESEGEERGGGGGVEVAVADVDALAVVGVVGVAEVADGGVVLPGGPGGGQLAGGLGAAEQDVGEGVADGGAELGDDEDVPHVLHGRQVDDAADVEHQEELVELVLQRADVADLGVGEPHVPGLGAPVVALAGVAGEDVDGGLALAVERDVEGGGRVGQAHAVDEGGHARLLGPGLDVGDEVGVVGLGDLVVGVQPGLGGQGEAGLLQALLDGDDVAGVDVAGAGPALDGAPRPGAVQGELAGSGQGEGSVGGEQHHGLGGVLAHDGEVVDLVLVQRHVELLCQCRLLTGRPSSGGPDTEIYHLVESPPSPGAAPVAVRPGPHRRLGMRRSH